MADARVRKLARHAQAGDEEAAHRLQTERCRAGLHPGPFALQLLPRRTKGDLVCESCRANVGAAHVVRIKAPPPATPPRNSRTPRQLDLPFFYSPEALAAAIDLFRTRAEQSVVRRRGM